MAKIGTILDSNEKKIVITQFIPVECREEGVEDYVTIKKLPYTIKKKIETMSMNSISGQTGKELFKYLKKTGKKPSDLASIDPMESMDIMSSIKISDEEAVSLSKTTTEIMRNTINYGVDPAKHSFRDMNDKPIVLDYDALDQIGNTSLIDCLVGLINEHSAGFILGE